ncbi:phosphoheptose isomerase [Planotetraspora thailandica]|uniref:Phosphoheptose isomerase n=1 Tax=Planotetraspora thailandica TaxID=487172 RepID=A0A8J3XRD1_9ACTN|nr:SIS domain-containing protein [Planotetraspora thailandica]GII51892.1 phosphoheptose isomerase [Planotetraspora thailandica]
MPVASMQQLAREAFARRQTAGVAVMRDAALITRAAADMAARFRAGGKLVVFGGGAAGTDAAHVAVEFMHPVIVGKAALPAVALSNDAATVAAIGSGDGPDETFAHQVRHWAGPADIAMGVCRDGRCSSVARALQTAHELGLLTVALTGALTGTASPAQALPAADHLIAVASADPRLVKEVHVTTYHLLWELVHVFLDQAGEGLT